MIGIFNNLMKQRSLNYVKYPHIYTAWIRIYSAVPLKRGQFFPEYKQQTPIAHVQSEVWGIFCEYKHWCMSCLSFGSAACTKMSYMIAV